MELKRPAPQSAVPARAEIVLHRWGQGAPAPRRATGVAEEPVRVRHVRVLDRGDLAVALLLVLAVWVTNQGAVAVLGGTLLAVAARHLLGGRAAGAPSRGRHRLRHVPSGGRTGRCRDDNQTDPADPADPADSAAA